MASIAFEEYKNKLNNLRPALDDLGGALLGGAGVDKDLEGLTVVVRLGKVLFGRFHIGFDGEEGALIGGAVEEIGGAHVDRLACAADGAEHDVILVDAVLDRPAEVEVIL